MFPDEASDALPLHRCMRFLPHHQDTGGFFVCVLQKVGRRWRRRLLLMHGVGWVGLSKLGAVWRAAVLLLSAPCAP